MSHLICPITHETMKDPVFADDGHTYERSAIEKWLNDYNTSPVTREYMSNRLVTNYNVRSQLSEVGFPVLPVRDSRVDQKTQYAKGPMYVLITAETCPWCIRAKEDNVQSGAPFEIVDFNSEKAKEILKMFDIKNNAIPIYVNLKNGKNSFGFKPIAVVLSLIN
jgi:hypothetical protein